MPKIFFPSLFTALLILGLSACQAIVMPSVVTPSGERIKLELALTEEEQMRGLMFRDQLEKDRGMLFVFDREEPRSFWMKNTLIPLDILYLDQSGKIIDIQTMQPCFPEENCPFHASAAPAQYALEVKAGMVEELKLKVGDRLWLVIPPIESGS